MNFVTIHQRGATWLFKWLYWLVQRVAMWGLARGSWLLVRTRLRLSVEGLEHIPRHGPVIIAARHFHHFYDGCILLGCIPRRIHIFVALDWAKSQRTRYFMEFICALAQWPVILRAERLKANGHVSPYAISDARRYLVRAAHESVRFLQRGKVLVIFPEAYPTIDPVSITKQHDRAFLPFRPGFVKLAEQAERKGQAPIAIVPAGFTYTREHGRWHVILRFGPAYTRHNRATTEQVAREVEQCVHTLSEVK